ncbi:hypothetical protein [Zavarzinella formosa]|uniref:hypothetical protein n=1 Tax=Zavarzinella formosa TaxID=360055 RepID=UPI0002D33C7C|nr:hypothetical protein [Zavarzinella formosa]
MSLPTGPGLNGSAGHSSSASHPAPSDSGVSGHVSVEPHPPARFIEQALTRQLSSFGWAGSFTPVDGELDHFQRDAVARAIATPDFLQIQGPVGTGKSRVLMEIARQAVTRAQRVLWLSPNPAALVAAVEQLARSPEIAVRRFAGAGQTPENLGPLCRERTAVYRERALLATRTLTLRIAATEAEDRLRLLESLPTVLREAGRIAPLLAENQSELESLTARRETLTQETEHDIAEPGESPSYLVQRIRKLDQHHVRETSEREALRADLATREASCRQAREQAIAVLEELRPKTEAVKSGGMFSLAKWKAKLDSTLPGRQAAAEQQFTEAEDKLTGFAAEAKQIAETEQTARDEYQGKRAKFLAEEIERRTKEINQRIDELNAAVAELAASQREHLARLEHAGLRPDDSAERLTGDIDILRQKLEEHRRAEGRLPGECAAAIREWGASAAITIGPVDGVTALDGERFDLMMIDDADGLPEAELHAATRLAGRWVLSGEPPEKHHRHGTARPEWWGRLWHALHHPRTWVTEGEHLVCRLHPLTAAERRKCDREPVADNPAIELRLASFLAEPVLAEVAFPANFQATAAREFLFRELDELTIQPATHTPVWEATDDRITCRFAPPESESAIAQHSGGLTEEVFDLDTQAIHFATAEGWTMESASEWLTERGLKRSHGRAAALHRSHRACPGLARWLNEAFRIGFHHPAPTGSEPHVEFLAVPDLRGRREPNPARTGRPGGAGYEIALHDAKQRGLLADELSRLLPDRGFVNLAEAQAVVQFAENHPSSSMRVTSPFPAQVIVLRHLLGKSRAPQVRVIDIHETDATECDWLVISLTRSHVSRAVTFGESPVVLRKLAGCARRKILFAGDPGTLSRRLQWEGPVDHLDATEAAHERNWVAALADCPRVSATRHRPSTTSA